MCVCGHLTEQCVRHSPDCLHTCVIQARFVPHQLYEVLRRGAHRLQIKAIISLWVNNPPQTGSNLVFTGDAEEFLGVFGVVHQLLVTRTVIQRERQQLEEETDGSDFASLPASRRATPRRSNTDPLVPRRHSVHRDRLPLHVRREDLLTGGGVETWSPHDTDS